jgi:hypothetical protein
MRVFMGTILLTALLGVMLAGCNGGSTPAPAGNALPLGNARAYVAGDQWQYALTGTFVSGAGSTAITPATATLAFDNTATAIGGVTDARKLTLTVPVVRPGHSETNVYTIAFKQTANGTINIYGISPADGAPMGAVTTGGGVMNGPDADQFATLPGWNANATIDGGYGDFTIATTKAGVEEVTVGGKTYQCFKVTGNKSFGGFASTFTVWINSQCGAFVKMTTSYTDVLGTTNLSYEMTSNTVGL